MTHRTEHRQRDTLPERKRAMDLNFLLPTILVMLVSGSILFCLWINYPLPTDRVELVFRVALGLTVASLGAFLPGLLRLDIGQGIGRIRATGAIGFFLIVYFFNPVSVVSIPTRTLSPAEYSAVTYFYNFIFPIFNATANREKLQGSTTQRKIDKKVRIIVWIPERTSDASHAGLEKLLGSRFNRSHIKIMNKRINRNLSVFSLEPQTGQDEVIVIDVPTGLSALRRISELRLGLDYLTEHTSRIAELEKDDVQKFKNTLMILLNKEHLSPKHVWVMSQLELEQYLVSLSQDNK